MRQTSTKKESRTKWRKLAAPADKAIDASDIPRLDEDFFREAQVRLPKPKQLVSIRIDSEVLDWFKRQGKGYQTKMNAVLRADVRAQKRQPHAPAHVIPAKLARAQAGGGNAATPRPIRAHRFAPTPPVGTCKNINDPHESQEGRRATEGTENTEESVLSDICSSIWDSRLLFATSAFAPASR